ncbi:MAG TPA: hypothetical protein PKX52_08475, partial [Methanomassiliicoccaceae archaeon]|nr:hypothetical protein [Methanomassiliicoccaceae archaeon]
RAARGVGKTVLLNEAQDMNGIMDGSSYFMYEGKNATKVVLPLPQNATSEPVNITLSTGQ